MPGLVSSGMEAILRTNERLLDRRSPKPPGPLDPRDLPWTAALEEHWEEMRAEVDALIESEVRLPTTTEVAGFEQGDVGRWTSFILCSYGTWIPTNVARCPRTAELVRSIPGLQIAGFSVLGAKTHLPRHRGPNRGALRYQIGLRVPDPPGSCRIEIGDTMHVWSEGKSLLFDHSVHHEAWNDASSDRFVLFIEVVWPLPGLVGAVNRATQKIFSQAAQGLPKRVEELEEALNA